MCMHYFDLYETSVFTNQREVIVRLFEALGTVYSLSVVLYYFYPPLELGRGIFVMGLILAAMLLFCWRGLFSKINSMPELADRASHIWRRPSRQSSPGGIRVSSRVGPSGSRAV